MDSRIASNNADRASIGFDADRNVYWQRLTQGLESLLAEKTFPQITVADIVRRAHTSRRTFYEHFESKEACLLALHRQASREEAAHALAAVDGTAVWQMQLRQAIEAWIAFADTRSELAMSWIRDLPLLGAAASDLQREVTDQFVRTIQTVCGSEGFRAAGGRDVSRARALVLIGGLERLAADAAQRGQKMAIYTDDAVQAAIALATGSRGES